MPSHASGIVFLSSFSLLLPEQPLEHCQILPLQQCTIFQNDLSQRHHYQQDSMKHIVFLSVSQLCVEDDPCFFILLSLLCIIFIFVLISSLDNTK